MKSNQSLFVAGGFFFLGGLFSLTFLCNHTILPANPKPIDLVPSGIDVNAEYQRYLDGDVAYVFNVPVLGKTRPLMITDPGREADYGFVVLEEVNSCYYTDRELTIATYEGDLAFVIIDEGYSLSFDRDSYSP